MISKQNIALQILLLCFCISYFLVYSVAQTPTEQQVTNISLTIYNSYTGATTLGPVEYTTGNNAYTCTREQGLSINSGTGNTWVVQGDIENILAGSETAPYDISITTQLTGGDGIKTIHTELFKGNEVFVVYPDLEVFLDTIGPTEPEIISPIVGQIITANEVVFEWEASIDSGAGVAGYTVVVSKQPNFYQQKTYYTTNTYLAVDIDLLYNNYNYRYIIAHDNTCNTTNSLPGLYRIGQAEGGSPGASPPNTNDTTNNENENNEENEDEEHASAEEEESKAVASVAPKTPREYNQKYTKQAPTIKNIKDLLFAQNIGTLIQATKQEYQEQNIGQNNAYTTIVSPGYLQKTSTDPRELIQHLHELSKGKSIEHRAYIYTIIHQLLPNWPAGIILFMSILFYDIEFARRWYAHALYFMKTTTQKR